MITVEKNADGLYVRKIAVDAVAFCIPGEADFHRDISVNVEDPDFTGEIIAGLWHDWLEANADKLPDIFYPPPVWIGRFSGTWTGDWDGTLTVQGREYPVRDSVLLLEENHDALGIENLDINDDHV